MKDNPQIHTPTTHGARLAGAIVTASLVAMAPVGFAAPIEHAVNNTVYLFKDNFFSAPDWHTTCPYQYIVDRPDTEKWLGNHSQKQEKNHAI
jgi:hypothetical protein